MGNTVRLGIDKLKQRLSEDYQAATLGRRAAVAVMNCGNPVEVEAAFATVAVSVEGSPQRAERANAPKVRLFQSPAVRVSWTTTPGPTRRRRLRRQLDEQVGGQYERAQ